METQIPKPGENEYNTEHERQHRHVNYVQLSIPY
jgi:hypothetical protein